MIVVGRGFWMIHDDSGIIWNLFLQSFTIFYIQIDTDLYIYIYLAWFSRTEWFCSFLLKTTNKPTKWFTFFWKMSIHSSQIGLVLQNGFVFLGGTFHRWVYVLNNFTNWFWCFFRKMKNTWFFSRNTTKWFYIFFGDLARGWGCLYKMVLVLF